MRRTLLALLLAGAVSPGLPARDALQAIDDCVTRLDNDLDVGYARIAARCAELTPALEGSGFAPWLPADWRRPDNELSGAGLSELRAQLSRESTLRASARVAPRSERVAAVLAAIARSDEPAERSWWQRFKGWLSDLFSRRPPEGEGWLSRWLTDFKLTHVTTLLIGWAAFALAVALAAAIVINELRIAGFFRRRAELRAPVDDGAGAGARADLAALEGAPPEEQPALLLAMIAALLAAQQRLPPALALTARELEQRARLPQESARERLAQLVAVSERVRFSAERVSGAQLATALGGGRWLLASLDGWAAAALGEP